MARYNFDDVNIKWSRHPDLAHLQFSILNVDEANYIVDILFKFDANERIILHRHVVHNNTFVVQGEHRIYEPNGELREIGRSAATDPAHRATCIRKAAGLIRTWSYSLTFAGATACCTSCSTMTRT